MLKLSKSAIAHHRFGTTVVPPTKVTLPELKYSYSAL